jgi:lycopene cyclase-like protein
VIGFGAAGGLIHPNTGYCVALNLNLAPVLAETIYNGLNSQKVSLENTAIDAWKVLWPPWRKRMSVFNRVGMELFCAMSIRQLSLFLRMFYCFPDEVWHGYLSNNVPFFSLTKGFNKGLARKIIT